ncbi:MAG: ATP-binding protein [Candidatus Nitrosocosmicus sp.]
MNYNGNFEKSQEDIDNSNNKLPFGDEFEKSVHYNDCNQSNFESIVNYSLKEKTVVVYGEDESTKIILHALNNSKERWDNYANSNGPTIAIGLEQLRKGMKNAYKRGVKIRYISEITTTNINYCKELMKVADLRHLDNAKGGMAVNESEYIATAHLQEAKPVSHLIYSNAKEIVEQQKLVFESLWNNSIDAEQRIKEIEDGFERIETRVFYNWDEINEKIKSLTENSEEILICSNMGLLRLVYNSFFDLYQKIMDKYDRGFHKGVRWITCISSKEDVETVKLFMDIGIKIRAIKNLYPLNYMICDKVFFSNIEEIDNNIERKIINSMLISNDTLYVNQFRTVFEDLWKNSIDARDMIENIQRGVHPEKIEIVSRASNAARIYLDLLKSAHKEILLLFPTTNAFLRQFRLGVIDLISNIAIKEHIVVRVLVPKNEQVEQLIANTKSRSKSSYAINSIEFRHIQQLLETRSTILIVDNKESFIMELKDDTKTVFHDAIGLSIYSNSRPGVSSYVSIFENLWKQTELYHELEQANKSLRNSEKLLNDFIHIAAHELRNPIQPILGVSEIIKSVINNSKLSPADQEKVLVNKKEISDLVNVIIKNTKKLSRLTSDILDLTKIETNSLSLCKEIVDLRLLMIDTVCDYNNQIISNIKNRFTYDEKNTYQSLNRDTRLEYSQIEKIDNTISFFSNVDKSRFSQIITNILDNAFKFTDENDTIYVELNKELKSGRPFAIVTIRDTGKGIDPEIMPRLFTKFTSRSFQGTGLGLYICKSIVEAHGGRIWADNNLTDFNGREKRGAIFSFSIPLIDENDINRN